MTIYISVEGTDGSLNKTISKRLKDYLSNIQYTVKVNQKVNNKHLKYILNSKNTTKEVEMLIQALDKQLIKDNEKYDIIINNTTFITQQIEYKENKTWIKQINKYTPPHNLHLLLKHKKGEKTPQIPNIHIIEYNDVETMINDIINVFEENLPKCKWCGKYYTINQYNKKYCSQKCRQFARQEQNRIHRNNYYKKYKNILAPHEKGALGSKGSLLYGTPNPNFKKEQELIKKEKYRQGIR